MKLLFWIIFVNLLEAARKSDIGRFIYINSAAVYGDPITLPINEEHPTNPLSPYGLSKLTGEKYTRLYYNLYELPTVCLRPFNIFSPRQNPESPYSGVITKFTERIRNSQNPVILGVGIIQGILCILRMLWRLCLMQWKTGMR
jgi:UDP-glucose 4-epimerase